MKNLIRIFILVLIICFAVLFDNKAFSQTPPQALKKPDSVLKDTTLNNMPYKIYLGSKGGKYVWVTSKTTGKLYKRYLKK